MSKVTLPSTPVSSFLPSFGYSPPGQGSGAQKGHPGLAAGGDLQRSSHGAAQDTPSGHSRGGPGRRPTGSSKRTGGGRGVHALTARGRRTAHYGGSGLCTRDRHSPGTRPWPAPSRSPRRKDSDRGSRPAEPFLHAQGSIGPTFLVRTLRHREVK